MAPILNFNGGMNNVTPPHLLPDNMAENITNLYLDKDGVWKDINNPEIMLDLSATEFSLAIKVIQWKPTNLPVDINPADDFVYIVFTSDGKAKLVYRGSTGLQIVIIELKARVLDTTTYRSVAITDVTEDVDTNTNGTTSAVASGTLPRRYYEDTEITMTAPVATADGENFYRWVYDSGSVLSFDRELSMTITASIQVIAEYVTVPYIRIEDVDGNVLTSLGEFIAMTDEYSETKTYYAGGIALTNNLQIYPPAGFEIKLASGSDWKKEGEYIEIAYATANTIMTAIDVRYAPEGV